MLFLKVNKHFMCKKAVVFLLVVGCLLSVQSSAQNNIKIQSTAVPFMLISPDARSGGMGNLSIAMTPEANDLFGNTAKLPLMKEKSGFLINYTPWLKDLGLNDVYLASMGYYKKLDDRSAINSSLRFFSLGNITFSDENGTELPSTKPSEFSFDFGYSFLLSDQFSFGTSLRYIHSKLVQGSLLNSNINYRAGNTLSADVSLFYKQNENMEGFHGGLVLSNLGGKISYSNETTNKYFIPANIGIGLAYLNKFDKENSVEFGIDVNRLLVPAYPTINSNGERDQYFAQSVVSSWFNSFSSKYGPSMGESLRASVGLEYNYTNQFYLRGGYLYEDQSRGNGQYFTLGTSFQYLNNKFNISYLVPSGGGLSRNPLSNTLRFGSIFYF
ncbi:MAG: hypothetical protein D4R94_06465 [Chitinophagaceae bacterium]|nr:MAG: hypothetical protein D4R94_06465 [Chitinophagaceae bacterium]